MEHARRRHGRSSHRSSRGRRLLSLLRRELLLELQTLRFERRLPLLERRKRARGRSRGTHQVLGTHQVGAARGLMREIA